MKQTLFERFFAGSVVLIAIVSVAFAVVTHTLARRHYLATLTDSLAALAAVIDAQIAPDLAAGRRSRVAELVRAVDARTGRRVTVIARDGTVLADSEHDPVTMDNHANRPEVRAALAGGIGSAVRYSATLRDDMLYVAVPAAMPGAGHIVRVSLFLRDFNMLIHRVKVALLRTTLTILAGALLAVFFLSRALTRPLRDLKTAAEEIAAGGFSARVTVRPPREIAALAAAFNTMAERIHGLFEEVSGRTTQLHAIIASISEALFVIRGNGAIVLSNPSFAALCAGSTVDGRYYWEVFRNPALEALIRQGISSGGKGTAGTIDHGGRHMLASVTKLQGRDEYAVLLHDVTEERRLAAVKRDFVTNVSHELRTPLTAMQSALELLHDDPAERDRYLAILARHTDRLTRLVADLLTLSELEHPTFELRAAPVDLRTLIDDCRTLLAPRAAEKGIALRAELPADPVRIAIDGPRIEQVLMNLLDNAIKYTDAGSVTVALAATENAVTLTVTDTGIGIPPGDLDRIFERFYVVDRSRSRKNGGTGLGLAIVKHIVLMHGGTITVAPAAPAGTRFTVTLPAAAPSR